MKLKIGNVLVFLPLIMMIHTLCMEQEEGDQPEKSSYQQQLEQRKKEQAAKFVRQQEEAKKEAELKKPTLPYITRIEPSAQPVARVEVSEQEKGKESKEEEPEVEPVKSKEEEEEEAKMLEEERRAETKRIVDEQLGTEFLKDAVAAIELERNALKVKARSEEKAKRGIPDSLIEFLWTNLDQLRGGDKQLIAQIIEWISNNEIDVNERHPEKRTLLDTLMHGGNFNQAILYAVLRNPFLINPGEYMMEEESVLAPTLRWRNALSMQLLFTPFALNTILEKWMSDDDVFSIIDISRDLQALKKTKNYVSYFAATTNLDLIRIILFLATHVHGFSDARVEQFMQELANLTGNETVMNGTSALMFAVGGGYRELVRELLRRGANPFQTNLYGDDALSIVEIQLQRVTIDQDLQQRAVYQEIKKLLEEYAKLRAKDSVRAALLLAKIPVQQQFLVPVEIEQEMIYEKREAAVGLPLAVGLKIMISELTPHEQQRRVQYVTLLDADELQALQEEIIDFLRDAPESTLLAWVRTYLPAGMVTALSAYLTSRSNP